MSDRVRMSWKVWIFKASEEFDLPCGCVGVFRKVESEAGVCEYVVCCPRRLSGRQAVALFQGVKELRHKEGKGASWYVMRELLLEMEFVECEHRAGEFVVPPVLPRSSKVKVKDPGARLKALKFHHVTF